jgi:hypothetical protein
MHEEKCDHCSNEILGNRIELTMLKKRRARNKQFVRPYFIYDKVSVHDTCLFEWTKDHYGEDKTERELG